MRGLFPGSIPIVNFHTIDCVLTPFSLLQIEIPTIQSISFESSVVDGLPVKGKQKGVFLERPRHGIHSDVQTIL